MFTSDFLNHRFEELTPKINETKLVTDMLWKAYEFTDDLVPLMEFTNEQLGAASKEIFTGDIHLESSTLPRIRVHDGGDH